jgi:hypothetical protein
MSDTDLSSILTVYHRYVEARQSLLDALQLGRRSNRDPLSEFSEWLVAALVGGTLAESPVQPDWDVKTLEGEKIQVRYLANSAERWVNEHEIRVNERMDSYAIVIFEELLPEAVIIFPARNLETVSTALGKWHGDIHIALHFTQANYRYIRNNASRFRTLGVRLYLPPDWIMQ